MCIRDSRFAISTHRAKRKKNLSKSLLDQIQGIGKQRKRALLNHFGSARAVESASFDDLKSVEGIEDNIAKKIYDYFHENNHIFSLLCCLLFLRLILNHQSLQTQQHVQTRNDLIELFSFVFQSLEFDLIKIC